jgi:hypothetical protein
MRVRLPHAAIEVDQLIVEDGELATQFRNLGAELVKSGWFLAHTLGQRRETCTKLLDLLSEVIQLDPLVGDRLGRGADVHGLAGLADHEAGGAELVDGGADNGDGHAVPLAELRGRWDRGAHG